MFASEGRNNKSILNVNRLVFTVFFFVFTESKYDFTGNKKVRWGNIPSKSCVSESERTMYIYVMFQTKCNHKITRYIFLSGAIIGIGISIGEERNHLKQLSCLLPSS